MPALLRKRVNSALGDAALRKAVAQACDHSTAARSRVIAELPDFEVSRREARSVRQYALDHLEELLSRFKQSFEAGGGVVHFASDGREGREIITGLLKEAGARQGVKSKSMVSEEIGLGEALTEAGIEAVESDLGEFIVQLAGEPPSHITAPALHRSRDSIGRLFTERLGIPFSSDPETLTRAARKHLRERFLMADFGLSGVNFFVAETGHLVIVENEGNARLGLSLPKMFIALTGIEKVLARLTDTAPLLRLLARSATGQRFSAYTHFLKPSRTGEDGPRQMHLVLLDNGRRAALADPVLREMLLCIRCGACLNICPVYGTVGGHAYGSVYPGPMGAVLSNLIGEKRAEAGELPHLSTLCGACKEVCPVAIDIPKLLLELRARSAKPLLHRSAALFWSWMMASEGRFRTLGPAGVAVASKIPGLRERVGG